MEGSALDLHCREPPPRNILIRNLVVVNWYRSSYVSSAAETWEGITKGGEEFVAIPPLPISRSMA
jgi:hypothetical protein